MCTIVIICIKGISSSTASSSSKNHGSHSPWNIERRRIGDFVKITSYCHCLNQLQHSQGVYRSDTRGFSKQEVGIREPGGGRDTTEGIEERPVPGFCSSIACSFVSLAFLSSIGPTLQRESVCLAGVSDGVVDLVHLLAQVMAHGRGSP
jgi:hypothetical protein